MELIVLVCLIPSLFSTPGLSHLTFCGFHLGLSTHTHNLPPFYVELSHFKVLGEVITQVGRSE